MEKRFVSWILLAGLLLGLAGCGGEDRAASDAAGGSSSPEVQSSEQEEPEEEWPEVALEQFESTPEDDALVREMVLTYGAEEETGPDGVTKLAAKGTGLLEQVKSWSDPAELTGVDYFMWFRSTTFQEDPAYREEHYKHPTEEGFDLFPQDIYEERVQRYFDIPVSHLRNEQCYDPELQGYWLGGCAGRIGKAELDYTYTKSGDDIAIDMTRTYPSGAQVTGRLYAQITGDGGWKYRRAVWYPPQVFPQDGSAWEELEGLTPEQRQLVERAEQLVRVFQVDTSDIPGDSWDNAIPYETRELDGAIYTRYRGSLYRNMEDLRADMLSVLTPEFFQRLNESGGLRRGIFTEEDGTLYCMDMARGTDRTYLEDRTQYRIENSGGDRISIQRYACYCDSAAAEDDPEPVSYRECPITLVNTADGWRVEELVLPY